MTYSQWGYPTSEKLFIQTITTTVACRLFAACLEVFAMYLTPAHAFQGAEGRPHQPGGRRRLCRHVLYTLAWRPEAFDPSRELDSSHLNRLK